MSLAGMPPEGFVYFAFTSSVLALPARAANAAPLVRSLVLPLVGALSGVSHAPSEPR